MSHLPSITYRKIKPSLNVEVYVDSHLVLTANKSSWGGYTARVGDLFKSWSNLRKLKANVRTRTRNYLRWGLDVTRIYQPMTEAEKEVLAAEYIAKTEEHL